MAAIGGKTAFVFSGGGSLGAIQVGMLRVLLSYGLKPDFVVLSSPHMRLAMGRTGSPGGTPMIAVYSMLLAWRRTSA